MTAKNGLPCPKCGNNEWNPSGDCAPCARSRVLKWQKENKEKKRTNARNWWRKHPGKILVNRPKPKQTTDQKKRNNKRTNEWKKKNPDRVKASNQKRRSQKKGADGSYTEAEWKRMRDQYNNRCLCCGRSDVELTVDHVVPLSKGGSNFIDNLQPLCLTCNLNKGTGIIDYRKQKPSIWKQIKLF